MTNPEHVLERYVADLQKFGTSTDKEEIVLYAAGRIKDLERQLALADKLLGEYSQFKRVKGSIEALHESYLALKECDNGS